MAVTASAPSPDRVPKGWAPEVWRLRVTLLRARERLPYATAEARLLDGVERYVRIAGRGRPAAGPWWAQALAIVSAVSAAVDEPTRAMLAPWVTRVSAVAGSGFRPLGLDDLPGRE